MKHIGITEWTNFKGKTYKTEIYKLNNTNYGERKDFRSKDHLCKCGHSRENHKYIGFSPNYTDGKCLIEGCECNCDGGWFCFDK